MSYPFGPNPPLSGSSFLREGWEDDEGADLSLDVPVTRWDARRMAFYAAPGITWWDANPYAVVTTSAAVLGTFGMCQNNAWYAGALGDRVYAVYADDSSDHFVHLVSRPKGGAYAGDWLPVHTTSAGSREERTTSASIGYPCLAVRRLPSGRPVTALAWRGTGDEMWACHRGTDSSSGATWEEVDVTALGGISGATHCCLAMDDAYNTWLVFAASDGTNQIIFLSVRPVGGTWSTPTAVNTAAAYGAYGYDDSDFPTIAVSGQDDPNGPTVLVVWRVLYAGGSSPPKRVLGKSMRVAAMVGWDISGAAEVDIGGTDECRDPCVAATHDGTFVVAYASPNSSATIRARSVVDPVAGSWSGEVEVAPVDAKRQDSQGIQNFPSLSIDGESGLVLVCWEDKAPSSTDFTTPFGAYAPLADLATWTPLGNLTDRPVSTSAADAMGYPCVIATAGRPRVFYRTPDGTGAVLLSRVGTWI